MRGVEVAAATREVESEAPEKAEGATKAWAAPMVAAASTSFMVAEVELEGLDKKGGVRVECSDFGGAAAHVDSYRKYTSWSKITAHRKRNGKHLFQSFVTDEY